MIDITSLCGGSVELESACLNLVSEFYDIIIKNGKIYIDTTTEKC